MRDLILSFVIFASLVAGFFGGLYWGREITYWMSAHPLITLSPLMAIGLYASYWCFRKTGLFFNPDREDKCEQPGFKCTFPECKCSFLKKGLHE